MKCALSALGPWHVTSQGSPKTFPSGQQAAVGGGTPGIIVGLCQGGFAEFELSARWSNESKEKRKVRIRHVERCINPRLSRWIDTEPLRVSIEAISRRCPELFCRLPETFRHCCELAVLQSIKEKLGACCPHDPARVSRALDSPGVG